MIPELRRGRVRFMAALAAQQLRSWTNARADEDARARAAERRREAIVAHAVGRSRYYAEAFRNRPRDGTFSELPFLEKAALIERLDDIVTDPRISVRQLDDYFREPFDFERRYAGRFVAFHTSGSTGRPAKLVWGPAEFGTATGIYLFHMRRLLAARGYRGTRPRIAYVGILDDYVGGNSWAHAFGSFTTVALFSAFQPQRELCAALDAFSPNLILTKPTLLGELSRRKAEGKLSAKPEVLIFAGENITPHDAEDIRLAFGTTALNSYSMCETGPIAFDGEGGTDRLVVYDEGVHVELIDEQLRPIREYDRAGELVVTNLYNRVMPLIRYRTGDRARFVRLAGRGLGAAISYVEGRGTRYFVFRRADGSPARVPEYPFWSLHVPGVLRYQVVQPSTGELNVAVQWADGAVDREAAFSTMHRKVERILEGRLDPAAVRVTFEAVPVIAPGRNGKVQITRPLPDVANGG